MSKRTNSPAMQRLLKLLDEGSFMEVGASVTARSTDFHLDRTDTESDGVITGHGLIDGNLVFVYSQDEEVLNGTLGEMHGKKIASVYEMAMKIKAPVIGLLDCGGIRLQESIDSLSALGELYYHQSQCSGIVPQICGIFGSCGGGMTAVAALSDFAFIEGEKASFFVNPPNTLPGNKKEKLDPSSPKYQSKENGILDGAGGEDEILISIRNLIGLLPENNGTGGLHEDCFDDLNRLCLGMEEEKADPRYLLRELSDEHIFFETKKDHAPCMVTGLIRLNGTTVGAIANGGVLKDEQGNVIEEYELVLGARACKKAAEFIRFCDAFDIPILSITNVKGLKASLCQEHDLAKAMAEMTYAFASADVPKVNLITGEAVGSAYVMMNSKALSADLVYAWPSASVSIMDELIAAKIKYPDAPGEEVVKKAKEFKEQASGIAACARRGQIDRLIEPQDTRKYLAAAFELLYTKNTRDHWKKHGTK